MELGIVAKQKARKEQRPPKGLPVSEREGETVMPRGGTGDARRVEAVVVWFRREGSYRTYPLTHRR